MTHRRRILSGIQSSGKLHLGNYYGALREFVALQENNEALYFIANLHALNSVHDPLLARRLTFETACAFLALGLDPARAVLFRQSDIPEVLELYWILGTLVPIADLRNAHSYKDKLERGSEADLGLFSYPVLMAADILLYDSDLVPVGRDQKQHLELTRDWAGKLNRKFFPKYDPQAPERTPNALKLPEALIRDESAVVPGRDGEKMSKTYGNTIDLFGTDKELEKQVKSIRTDSTPPESPKPLENQPLLDLLKLVLPPAEVPSLLAEWGASGAAGKGYGYFKGRLLDAIHTTFDASRRRYAELLTSPDEVERVLIDGAARARAFAAPVITRIREAVGL